MAATKLHFQNPMDTRVVAGSGRHPRPWPWRGRQGTVGFPFPLDGSRAKARAGDTDLPGSHRLLGYLRVNTASYGKEDNVVLVDAPAI